MEQQISRETIAYIAPWLPIKTWEIVHDAASAPRRPDGWNIWHCHEEAEFLAILEGTMKVETVDGRYEPGPGSVLVLGSSEPHRTCKLFPVRYIVLQVNMKAMLDAGPSLYSFALAGHPHPLSRHNDVYAGDEVRLESFRLIRTILQEASLKRRGYELAVSGCVRLLFYQLVRNMPRENDFDPNRMRDVLEHIETRLSEPLRIRDLLPLANVSYHHFIKSFRQCVGSSFVEYVHGRRIRQAEKLLLTGDLNNEEIGYRCGFATPAQFYRIFKRLNRCSPNEFRRRLTGAKPL